jgi:hypothetical protein
MVLDGVLLSTRTTLLITHNSAAERLHTGEASDFVAMLPIRLIICFSLETFSLQATSLSHHCLEVGLGIKAKTEP